MKRMIIVLIITAFLASTAAYAQSSDQSSSQGSVSGGEAYNPDYNVLPIVLALIMLYLISYLLYDSKIIRKVRYKQMWSIVLVGSMLISGITGIILVLITDYGLRFNLNFNLLFWHVETGIIMAVVLFFHIHIHWKKFKRILQANN
ncbi:hypothetical protein [Methanobacterium sp.]|uniref:hypothetical protein n=1 Tax=Methanobacterium sp. TaxID=2164 RepID=UPI003C71AA36